MTSPHALITVKISPKASRDALLGWHDGRLKIAVTAAPERGRANAAVVALLAERLGVARQNIEVVSGHTQPIKRLRIDGIEASALQARIDTLLSS